MRYAILAVSFLLACSTEQITQTETHIIPPLTIDTTQSISGYTFYGTSPCDTANILHKYCKGYVEGNSYGISWGVNYATEVDTVIKRDTLLIVRTVPVIKTNIVRDTIRFTDIDTVRVITVEEYGFWKKVGLVLSSLGAFMILLALGFMVWKFKLI